MTYPYQPPSAPSTVTPARRGLPRGCAIALAIAGGLFAVSAVAGGYAAWRFSRTPTGRTVVSIARESVRIAVDSQRAPGAAEVRALGCERASVLDLERFAALVPGDAGAPRSRGGGLFVACEAPVVAAAPDCDAVARTYVAAARPARSFAVVVRRRLRQQNECAALYAPDGARQRDLAPDEAGAR